LLFSFLVCACRYKTDSTLLSCYNRIVSHGVHSKSRGFEKIFAEKYAILFFR
jgi:hypothetical protein